MAVALAGPLVNLCLAILFFTLPNFREKNIIIYTNLLIGLFNLLPIYPLDGERAIEGVLKCLLPSKEVENITYITSNVSLIILSIISLIGMVCLRNVSILAIVVYLWIIVSVENKRYKLKNRLYNIIDVNK